MQREGVKEGKERAQSEEASRRKERLRRMLIRRKTALRSKVTKEENKLNNQMLTKDVTLDRTDMPDYASISKFGGVGMVLHGNMIYGRSPDFKDDEAIYAQHQRFTSEHDGPAPGSTVEKME